MENNKYCDTDGQTEDRAEFQPDSSGSSEEAARNVKPKSPPAWLGAIIAEGDSSKSGQMTPIETMAKQIQMLTEEVERLHMRIDSLEQTGCSAGAAGAGSTRSAETTQSREERPMKKAEETTTQKPKNKALNIISNILFYLVIISIVLGAFLVKSSSGGRPTVIAGYSAFTVLTSSMEDVYPKGSLIVSKSVDAGELEVGDDITFMVSETSSVTHRIISITENYAGTGKRGFETQGVMNENPDKDMVAAANVVGKVVFCSTALGKTASFVKQNWPILAFSLVVIVALIYFLKWNARREEREGAPDQTAQDSKVRVRK